MTVNEHGRNKFWRPSEKDSGELPSGIIRTGSALSWTESILKGGVAFEDHVVVMYTRFGLVITWSSDERINPQVPNLAVV